MAVSDGYVTIASDDFERAPGTITGSVTPVGGLTWVSGVDYGPADRFLIETGGILGNISTQAGSGGWAYIDCGVTDGVEWSVDVKIVTGGYGAMFYNILGFSVELGEGGYIRVTRGGVGLNILEFNATRTPNAWHRLWVRVHDGNLTVGLNDDFRTIVAAPSIASTVGFYVSSSGWSMVFKHDNFTVAKYIPTVQSAAGVGKIKKWFLGNRQLVRGFVGTDLLFTVFKPNHLDSGLFWLDASDASTLTMDGERVDSWEDKFSGKQFIAPTTESRPYSGLTTVGGGLNAVGFVGANSPNALDYDAGVDVPFGNWTMFSVVQTDGASSASPYPRFVSSRVSANGGYDYANPNNILLLDNGRGQNQNENLFSTFTRGTSANALTNTGAHVVKTAYTGSTATVQVDGGAIASSGVSGTSSFRYMRLGGALWNTTPSALAGGDWLNGKIGEVVCYNRTLTTEESDKVYDYLTEKWGGGTYDAKPWAVAQRPGTVLATDTFTRADSDTLGTTETGGLTWIKYNGFRIRSNRLTTDSGNVDRFAMVDAGTPDVRVSADYMTTDGTGAPRPCLVVRYVDGNNFLMVQLEPDNRWTFYNRVGGGYVDLGRCGMKPVANVTQRLTMEVKGKHVTFTAGNDSMSTSFAGGLTATVHGLRLYSPPAANVETFDNFMIEAI